MPQIKTTASAWADVYALSGITPGTALLVQNQSGNLALLQLGATAPNVNDNTGRWLQSGAEAVIDAGAPGLWMRCSPNGITAYVQGATS